MNSIPLQITLVWQNQKPPGGSRRRLSPYLYSVGPRPSSTPTSKNKSHESISRLSRPFVCFVVQTCQPRAWRWLTGTGKPLGFREVGRRGGGRRVEVGGKWVVSCKTSVRLPGPAGSSRAVWNTNGAKERETHESISRLSRPFACPEPVEGCVSWSKPPPGAG
jgi:hypothetical protein